MLSVPLDKSIADLPASCLVPRSGVEPDGRALEERCLFRLAYEAEPMMITRPSRNIKSPEEILSEPLVFGLYVASARATGLRFLRRLPYSL